MGSLLNVPGLRRTSRAFRSRLVELAQTNDLNPDWIAAVIAIESGFRPNVPNGKALGLIQFYRDFFPGIARAAGMDVEWEDLFRLTAEQQLPLVMAYFRMHGLTAASTPTDYLVATFLPSQRGKPRSAVLGKRDAFDQLLPGTKLSLGTIYAANPAYDTNGDGVITVGDLEDQMQRVIDRANDSLRVEVLPSSIDRISHEGRALLTLTFTLGAAAAMAIVFSK